MRFPWQDSDRVIQQPEWYYAFLELWDFIQLLADSTLDVCGVEKWGRLLDTHSISQSKVSLATGVLLKSWIT